MLNLFGQDVQIIEPTLMKIYQEIAPTSRSTCATCGYRIFKDKPRVLIIAGIGHYAIDKKICKKCAQKLTAQLR